MAAHSKAPIIEDRAYLFIYKREELCGSESGDKAHIRIALWHETHTHTKRSQRFSVRKAINGYLGDALMTHMTMHPPDNSLLTQH